jgi:hypothetical protein
MVFSFENNSCAFKLRAYSRGSLLCNDDTCILCKDESWDWPVSVDGIEIHAVPGKDFSKLGTGN